MSSTLREKLKLSQIADEGEVTRMCNNYIHIYENVLKNSNNTQIKQIAKNRIEDLCKSAQAEGIAISSKYIFQTEGDSDPSIEYMLSSCADSQGTITNSEATEIESQISKLPECARKYYLKCCLIKGTKSMNIETANELVATINNACRLDPLNFVYKQISNDIEKSVNQYQSELNAWKISEDERIKHEKKVETTKEVFAAIGTVILGILGAIGAVIAGALGLCCECADGCDC